jgi:hypothetical protein
MGYFKGIADVYLVNVLMRFNQSINRFDEVVEIGVRQADCLLYGVFQNETVLNKGYGCDYHLWNNHQETPDDKHFRPDFHFLEHALRVRFEV